MKQSEYTTKQSAHPPRAAQTKNGWRCLSRASRARTPPIQLLNFLLGAATTILILGIVTTAAGVPIPPPPDTPIMRRDLEDEGECIDSFRQFILNSVDVHSLDEYDGSNGDTVNFTDFPWFDPGAFSACGESYRVEVTYDHINQSNMNE